MKYDMTSQRDWHVRGNFLLLNMLYSSWVAIEDEAMSIRHSTCQSGWC